MDAKLIVVAPQEQAGEYKLNLPALVGRGREATLKLLHPQVSRKHCEIRESGDRLLVRDLGSMNGTYVAGKRIKEQSTLAPGQLLTVGAVTFRAEYDRSPGDETRTDVAALGAAGLADIGPDAMPTERFDEQAFLAADEDRGHSPPGFDPDWLQGPRSDATETRSGDMSMDDTFRDHSPRRGDSPDVGVTQAASPVDEDDLPSISFDDEESPPQSKGAADDFDPLDVLGSPDEAADPFATARPESDELRSADLEPFDESEMTPKAAAGASQADEIELEPFDLPADESIGELESADWDLAEDDASAGKPTEQTEGKKKTDADDEDLDDFLKDLK